MRKPREGDVVKYSKPFLKSIGSPATDPMWHFEGLVTRVDSFGDSSLATIDWGTQDAPNRVNIANLIIKGKLYASEA